MKECILFIIYFMIANFAIAQNDADFWLEEERLNKQFLQKHQAIQIMKHQRDSLNGAYVNSLIQILKSDFPNRYEIHSNCIYELFQNNTDTALFSILNIIDLELVPLTNTRSPVNDLAISTQYGFNVGSHPIFKRILSGNDCFVNSIIFYFVNKFPLEEIKGDLKMKMWLKIFERNKAYFNECCNNYFTHSSDRVKFKKISEIRKLVNGE